MDLKEKYLSKCKASCWSIGKANIKCKRSLQHVLWASRSVSREDRETDFPSEKMPRCCVYCSTSPCPGQQPEILNINASKDTEIAFLSYKNSLGSRGFPVPLSTLCPSVLQIAIIISSKRKWAAFAKKRQPLPNQRGATNKKMVIFQ